jgi:hypothetical protein
MDLLKSCKLKISSVFLVICYVCSISGYTQILGPSNQSEAYFNGSSYLRLQTTVSLKKQTGLSFRTCSGAIPTRKTHFTHNCNLNLSLGGSLFSQQQNDDLLELSVNSEAVLFFAKTAGKQFNQKIQGNFLNNKWHVVVLQYELGNLTLQVDGERRVLHACSLVSLLHSKFVF